MKISRKWKRAWSRGKPSFIKAAAMARLHRGEQQQRNKKCIAKSKPSIVQAIFRPAAVAAGLALTIMTSSPAGHAMPADGQVTAGQGSIAQNGSNMTITQTTDKLALNWQSFNIANGEKVQFVQPSVNATALNRVIGNSASSIYGQLSANGRVFLINTNGILFSPTARVDTGAMVASSLNMTDIDFVAGRYKFSKGSTTGSVINQGNITAADGGFVALLGENAINEGVIVANKGSVVLGAGEQATLDMIGDGLINLAVDQAALDAQVENKNLIQADGGLVVMTARVAGDLAGTVVNNTGVIRAQSLTERNGKIILDGGNDGAVQVSGSLDVSSSANLAGGSVQATGKSVSFDGTINANGLTGGSVSASAVASLSQTGSISVVGQNSGGNISLVAGQNLMQTTSAQLDVSGVSGSGGVIKEVAGNQIYTSAALNATGTSGGSIQLSSNTIKFMGASADASGTTGSGGSISIGGGWHGATVDGQVNAENTTVSPGSVLKADGGLSGDGGQITVWSQQQTAFGGTISAYGGSQSGNGGKLEISSSNNLLFAGTVAAGSGQAASLLLDPKNITIVDAASAPASMDYFSLTDPNPGYYNYFGEFTVALTTGNIVVPSFGDSFNAYESGAVYLFNSTNGALISTLRGSSYRDRVGNGGYGGSPVLALPNGNYVISSIGWANGKVTGAGAVTWGSGISGVSGLVSSSNSLVGSKASDIVGSRGVTVLTTGDYVVSSPNWDNGTVANAGAVTWGSGTSGVTGKITSSNSLVGSHAGDSVGSRGVTALSNGNYVVNSPAWANGTKSNAGAVTWGNGTSGVKGAVSSSNSLVGGTADDYVGGSAIVELTDGDYVVASADWSGGKGAVTWGNGMSGVKGVVSSSNSLVGSRGTDRVGHTDVNHAGVIALTNGNYVISNPSWSNDMGAVTWGSGTSGVKGLVSSNNSLVGGNYGDKVGTSSMPLSNGNYVVTSVDWKNGTANPAAGAVTWGNGMSGVSGVVNSSNSLVGSQANDRVGRGGVKELTNGNYVVSSYLWKNGTNANAGAVTWGSGTSGVSGVVDSSNSLVGSQANDYVGGGANYIDGVTVLTNGNYVVSSANWANGTLSGAGAVTWGSGTSGVKGVVDSSNSLVGSHVKDYVGGSVYGMGGRSDGVIALTNGNYVVSSSNWTNGMLSGAGAVTWGNGTSGVSGVVDSSNSLVGSHAKDYVGGSSGGISDRVTALTNGNYVVRSSYWANGTLTGAGAVTWGNGTSGVSGVIDSSNSLVGSHTNDHVGKDGITALPNGNYVVRSSTWANGMNSNAGAVTWGSGTSGVSGAVSISNSLVGSQANDYVGSSGITVLPNGNYVVSSENWANGTNTQVGAVTWGSGTSGVKGTINSNNSILGNQAGDTYGRLLYGDGLTILDLNDYVLVANWYYRGTTGRVDIIRAPGGGGSGSGGGGDPAIGQTYSANPSADATIAPSAIAAILNTGTALTLQANNDITVTNAITVTPASGSGGHLTMQAGRSIILNDNITTANGNFTAIANDIAANGVVSANRDSGAGSIIMASGKTINAGSGNVSLSVKNSDIVGSSVGNISLTNVTGSNITVDGSSGSAITLNGAINNIAGNVSIIGKGNLTLETGSSVVNNSGDITLDNGGLGGSFINNSGAGALQAAAGHRWLIYSTNPATDTFGGLASYNQAVWNVLGSNYPAGSAQTGNRYLFSYQPTLTIASTSASKIYGDTISLANNYSVSGLVSNTYGGVFLPDTAASSYSGAPTVTSTGAAATANVTTTPYTINTEQGTLYSPNGYNLQFASTGQLTVNPALMTITTDNASRTYGTSNPTFTATYSGFKNSDTASVVSGLNLATTATSLSNVGQYAITGSGATANNYTFNYVPATLTINKAPLIISASTNTRTYDGTIASSGTPVATGLVNGNSVTSLVQAFDSKDAGNRTLSVTGYVINDNNNGNNYAVTTNTALGTITPKTLAASFTGGVTKVYDGTTTANVSTLGVSNWMVNGTVSGETISLSAGGVLAASGSYASSDAGSGLAVTANLSGLTSTNYSFAGGASAGNYILPTSAAGQGSITKRSLVVTAGDMTKTYGQDLTANMGTGKTAFTITDTTTNTTGILPGASIVSGQALNTVSLASNGATTTAHRASGDGGMGLYSITASDVFGNAAFNANNYTITYAPGTMTVNPASAISVTANNASKTYGDNKGFTGSEFTATGLVGSDSISFVTLTSAGAGSTAHRDGTGVNGYQGTVGNYNITATNAIAASGTDLANDYAGVNYSTGTLSISPKSITVKSDNASKEYGDSLNLSSVNQTATGLVNGDKVTSKTITASSDVNGHAGNLASANAGTYTLTPSAVQFGNTGTGATNAILAQDYAVTYSTSTLTVTQANLTLATLTPNDKNKVYGNTLTFNGSEYHVVSGLVNSDWLDTSHDMNISSTGAAASSNVGTYAITMTGTPVIKHTETILFWDNITTVTGNYRFLLTPGTLTVTPRPITITPTAQSKTYGQTANLGTTGFSIGGSGLVNGNAINSAILASTGAAATAHAGNYAMTASNATFSSGNASNYAITYSTANNALTVNPLGITIKADNQSKTYGDTHALGTAAFSVTTADSKNFLPNGDTISSVTLASTGAASSAHCTNGNQGLGRYSITASGAQFAAGTQSSDYTVSYANTTEAAGTLTINPKAINAAVNNATTTYGTVVSAPTVTLTGTVNGDVITAGVDTSTLNTVTTSVGSYAMQVGTNLTGTYKDDYVLATTGNTAGILTVSPKTLTLASTIVADKVYDGTTTATITNYGLTGMVNGETLTATSDNAIFDNRNVGVGKVVTIAGITLGNGTNGGLASNYTVSSSGTGVGTITPRLITVTAATASKTYDGNLTSSMEPTITLGSLATGDTATFSQAYADKNAGTGKALIPATTISDGNSGQNYTVTLTNSTTGIITQAPLTITSDNASRTYGAANPNFTAQYSGLVGGDTASVVSGLSLATGATTASNVGSYAISGSAGVATNYTITYVPGTLTIHKAPLTIAAVTDTKSYDGTTFSAAAPIITGLVNGDSVSQLVQVFNDKNAGSRTLTLYNYKVNDNNNGGNYEVTTTTATGTINRKQLTAGFDGTVTKVYDGTNAASLNAVSSTGWKINDAVGNEMVSLTTNAPTSGVYASTNAGMGLTVTANLSSLTEASYTFGNGALASNYILPVSASGLGDITKRPIVVTAANASKNYGDDVMSTMGSGKTAFTITDTTTNTSGIVAGAAIVNGETLATATLASDGAVASAHRADGDQGMGAYSITPSTAVGSNGFNAANYDITYRPGVLTVDKAAAITVTANAANKTYGDVKTLAGTEFSVTGAARQ